MDIVKLKTLDDVVFDVEYSLIRCSSTIIKMIDDQTNRAEGDGAIIPLRMVTSSTFQKILDFLRHHSNDPETSADELTTNNVSEIDNDEPIPPWDLEFLNIDGHGIYQLCMAAFELRIDKLMNLIYKNFRQNFAITREQN